MIEYTSVTQQGVSHHIGGLLHCGTLSWRGLNQIKLAYYPKSQHLYRLGQYASAPGDRAYCSADRICRFVRGNEIRVIC